MIGWILLALLVGIILGFVLFKIFEKKPQTFGDLVIFKPTEPGENPLLYVDWDLPPQRIYKEKYVVLRVSPK